METTPRPTKVTQKIYDDAKDVNVRNVVIYAGEDDGTLFYDSDFEEGIAKDDLFELFTKGVIVNFDDKYYVPTMYSVTGDAGAITVNGDGVAYVFYSSEHVSA